MPKYSNGGWPLGLPQCIYFFFAYIYIYIYYICDHMYNMYIIYIYTWSYVNKYIYIYYIHMLSLPYIPVRSLHAKNEYIYILHNYILHTYLYIYIYLFIHTYIYIHTYICIYNYIRRIQTHNLLKSKRCHATRLYQARVEANQAPWNNPFPIIWDIMRWKTSEGENGT